jgi:L,D-peptidoglycan transpeptidase YkuD (ErfK/YbiS/YcfS/YnhG family)
VKSDKSEGEMAVKTCSDIKNIVFKHSIFLFFVLALTGCAPKQTIEVRGVGGQKASFVFFDDGIKALETTANIGRNGIAKIGEKREGDGKTPSGTYEITMLFGYDEQAVDMPYIKADDNICVDDEKSRYYNQIIDANKSEKEWESYEEMKRKDHQYRYGAVIGYNADGVKGLGSCIFIHIKKDENSPTAGCVGLSEDEMKRLFFKLKSGARPVITILHGED